MGKELGTLVVVVLKAKNLYDIHSFYKQDPFAQVTLNGTTHKTEPDIKGGQHPEWDAEFRFPIDDDKSEKHRMMEVVCLRKESKRDEEIGRGKLDISNVIKTGEFDDWVKIEDSNGVFRGEIYLEMTYYAAGPPVSDQRSQQKPSELLLSERLARLNAGKQSALPGPGPHLPVGGGKQGNPGKLLTPEKAEAPLPPIPEPNLKPPATLMHVPTILLPGPRRTGHSRSPDNATLTPDSNLPGFHSPPKGGSPPQGSLSAGLPQPSEKLNGRDRAHSAASVDGLKPFVAPDRSDDGSYFIDSRQASSHPQQHPQQSRIPTYPSSLSTTHPHSPDMVQNGARRSSGGPGDNSVSNSRVPSYNVPAPLYVEPAVPVQNETTVYHHSQRPPVTVYEEEVAIPQNYRRDYSPPTSYRNARPPAPLIDPSPRQPSVISYHPEPQISESTPAPSFPTPQILVGTIPRDSTTPMTYQNYAASVQPPPPPTPHIQPPPFQLPPPLPANNEGYSPAPFLYPPPVTPPAYHPPPSASPPLPYQYNYPPPPQPQSPFHIRSESPKSDPHLLARYSTPLPLPADKQENAFHPRVKPPTPPSSNNIRPSLPPRIPGGEPVVVSAKTQEELDAELARQLDAELNLDATPQVWRDSYIPRIPGGF